MSLFIPADDGKGNVRAIASPKTHEVQHLSLDIARLAPGQSYAGGTEGRELCIVILGGQLDVTAGDETFGGIGQRANVFGGAATAVYVPPGTSYQIRGSGEVGAEAALCYAASEDGADVTLIEPADVVARDVGAGNWRRSVQDVLAKVPARTLLLGETYNAPGNWSSYPPHKHDEDKPGQEVILEEIYHFRANPPGGFGVQCLYTEDQSLNEAMLVRDGDTVIIPRGYHPVAAAPGYEIYYLWFLAGPRRTMRPFDDPAHAWVKATEAMLK
jgi:5-deoxy-glucuronate isomerase